MPLRADGPLGGGAVPGRDLVQTEFLFDQAALGLGDRPPTAPNSSSAAHWTCTAPSPAHHREAAMRKLRDAMGA